MCHSCLSIQLMPEFGWSIKDQNVFGPGSVFQGFVTINNSSSTQHHVFLKAEKIRVVFTSTEAILPYTISPGVIRSSKKSIFTIQKTLWDNKILDITPKMKSEYTFPFTIQLPMVQFPPSMQHPSYKAEYKLIAIVDMADTTRSFRSELPIIYMPLIETSLLKSPMIINTTTKDKLITANVKLGAQDYVPGDHVDIELKLSSSSFNSVGKKRQSSSSKSIAVITELYQTMKILSFKDVPDQVAVVASESQRLTLETNNNPVSPNSPSSMDCVVSISLFVPTNLPPSFQGNLSSVLYAIHIRVQQKSALGGIWKHASQIGVIPITVGTLGYGIRSSDLLKNYTTWDVGVTEMSAAAATANNMDGGSGEVMPVPKFMQDIEYEEALPVYCESSNLPSYHEANTTPPPTIGT